MTKEKGKRFASSGGGDMSHKSGDGKREESLCLPGDIRREAEERPGDEWARQGEQGSRMSADAYDDLAERLLEETCWVIDFLPRQVPPQSGGQYFAVERFYLANEPGRELYQTFAHLLLRLNCYTDMVTGEGGRWTCNLPPEELYAKVSGCGNGAFLNFLLPAEDALLSLCGGDLHLTMYHPPPMLVETVGQLASALGLFLRKGI